MHMYFSKWIPFVRQSEIRRLIDLYNRSEILQVHTRLLYSDHYLPPV